MDKTPLEQWIASKVSRCSNAQDLSRKELEHYQLSKLQDVIGYVQEKSPFYRKHLARFSPAGLQHLEHFQKLPFTTVEDLRTKGPQFLCVSQNEIKRVVTLPDSDPTTEPRRVYFTAEEIELTLDFFHHGMTSIVQPGQKVLILMPGERPDSVGDLLAKALSRMDVQGTVHGLVQDPGFTIQEILRIRPDALVGIPVQALSIVRHKDSSLIPKGLIKNVLLSSDYVSPAIVAELGRVLKCRVFNHYGTTEMGFGGGVECSALQGYHLREADLFIEIVDPVSGLPQPDGIRGEVVFSTLTRRGMPLLRYRTGDISRFLTDPCPCGTVLRRLDAIRGRLTDFVRLGQSHWLCISDLDDILFSVPGVLNFSAVLTNNHEKDILEIKIKTGNTGERSILERVFSVLTHADALSEAIADGSLSLKSVAFEKESLVNPSAVKRAIQDKRKTARLR